MSYNYQKPDFATLCRHYAGEASSAENESVVTWRDLTESNQQRYQQFKKVWALSYDVPAEKLDFNPDQVWKETAVRFYAQNILEKAREIQKQEAKPKVIPLQRWLYAAAASVLLAMVGYAAYQYSIYNPMIRVVADANKPMQLTLEDGTKVLLNKKAILQYPTHFEENRRDVILEGDAIFEVAKNPKSPFRIEGNKSVIEVLGTIFRLKTSEKSLELAVKEGRVGLSDKGKESKMTKLNAGQKAILKGGKLEIRPVGPNDFALASGTLTFENASLGEILATLESFYEKKIEVQLADTSLLESCKMTVNFENQSWDSAIETLHMLLFLDYSTTTNGIVIKGLDCDLDVQTKKK